MHSDLIQFGVNVLVLFVGVEYLICATYFLDLIKILRWRRIDRSNESIGPTVFRLVFSFCMMLITGGLLVLAIRKFG